MKKETKKYASDVLAKIYFYSKNNNDLALVHSIENVVDFCSTFDDINEEVRLHNDFDIIFSNNIDVSFLREVYDYFLISKTVKENTHDIDTAVICLVDCVDAIVRSKK